MVLLLLLVIGFFITTGTLGAQVIGAFGLAQYLLWFIAGLTTFISLIVVGILVFMVFTFPKDAVTKILSGAGGIIFLPILLFLLNGYSYTYLWLSYYITSTTVVTATTWAAIGSGYAIIAFAGLFLFARYTSNTNYGTKTIGKKLKVVAEELSDFQKTKKSKKSISKSLADLESGRDAVE